MLIKSTIDFHSIQTTRASSRRERAQEKAHEKADGTELDGGYAVFGSSIPFLVIFFGPERARGGNCRSQLVAREINFVIISGTFLIPITLGYYIRLRYGTLRSYLPFLLRILGYPTTGDAFAKYV